MLGEVGSMELRIQDLKVFAASPLRRFARDYLSGSNRVGIQDWKTASLRLSEVREFGTRFSMPFPS